MEIAQDPFRMERADIRNSTSLKGRERYGYTNFMARNTNGSQASSIDRFGQWRLYSAGPDRYFFYTGTGDAKDFGDWSTVNYDPTNGTVSYGDIFRTQKDAETAKQ